MLKEKAIRSIEMEISMAVSRIIKNNTCRGPAKTEVTVYDKHGMILMQGFMLPNEIMMSNSNEGFYDVKLTRLKWFELNRNDYIETLSQIIKRKVIDVFYDFNPKSDTGVATFLFE